MKILLATYKSIGWIVPAYVQLHQKYWGSPVVLLAEDDYSGGRLEFVRPPDDISTPFNDKDAKHHNSLPGEFPAWRYTDILAWYMRTIKDKLVIIMMADYLIYRPVDKKRLCQLATYMLKHDILRGQVGDDTGLCCGEKTDTYKDIDIWEGAFLPSSLTPAMWNREQLLGIMPLNDTPWGMEIKMRDAFYQGNYRAVAPAPGIVRYLNALRGRDMSKIVLTESVYKEVGHLLRIKPAAFVPEIPDYPQPEVSL